MTRALILYRWFAVDRALLYVGKSIRPIDRLDRHIKSSLFSGEAANITLQHFDNERSLHAAEIAAIRNEKPKYNTIFNGTRAERAAQNRRIMLFDKEAREEDKADYQFVKELRKAWLDQHPGEPLPKDILAQWDNGEIEPFVDKFVEQHYPDDPGGFDIGNGLRVEAEREVNQQQSEAAE